MLDYGRYGLISDSARAKKINPTYVGGILRLTLLAPEIVAEGRQPTVMTLPALMGRFPVEWVRQVSAIVGGPLRAAPREGSRRVLIADQIGHQLTL